MSEGKTIWNLTALLTANVNDYMAKMDQAKKKNSEFTKVVSEMKNMLLTAFSVAAVTNFAKQSLTAYMEASKGEQMLTNAMRGREDVQKRLLSQAKRIAATTLFDDDQIIAQQAFLASLGKTEQQINDIIDASVQYSTVSGKDFNSVVQMLTGTYGGQVRELGKMIPELKNLTKEQLANGGAVKYVLDTYKGYAEGAANSPAGAIKNMAKAWDELKEAVGGFIANNKFVQEQVSGWTKIFTILASGDATTFGEKLHAFWGDTDIKEIDKIYKKAIDGAEGAAGANAVWNESWQKLINPIWNAGGAVDELKTKVTSFYDAVQKEAPVALEGWMTGGYSQGSGNWMGSDNQEQDPQQGVEPWMMGQGIEDGKWLDRWTGKILEAKRTTTNDLTDLNDSMMEQVNALNDALSAAISDLIVMVADNLGKVFSGEMKMNKSFFLPVLEAVGQFSKKMGSMMIGYGVAMKVFKNAYKHPEALIAAGIALVAIGGAISSLASTGLSGSSSGSGGGGSNAKQYKYISGTGINEPIKVEVYGKLKGEDIYMSSARGYNAINAR
jgi:hypothetical protein